MIKQTKIKEKMKKLLILAFMLVVIGCCGLENVFPTESVSSTVVKTTSTIKTTPNPPSTNQDHSDPFQPAD